MAANGMEVDKKGRPAFKTNVEGVYAAGDARRGPATVVEGIADAAAFAEAVIGAPHPATIPAAAHVTAAGRCREEGRAPAKLSLPRGGAAACSAGRSAKTAWTPARTARMSSPCRTAAVR